MMLEREREREGGRERYLLSHHSPNDNQGVSTVEILFLTLCYDFLILFLKIFLYTLVPLNPDNTISLHLH